jgi:uncharacterized membrane protein YhaH (DUF805 family)
MNIINVLFGFDGRIRRLQWWLGTIAIEIVVAVLNQLFGISVEAAPAAMTPRILALVITIVSLYPLMALTVKRLHDRDLPGTMALPLLLAFLVIPVGDLFGYFDEPTQMTPIKLVIVIITGAIGLGYLIELGFRRGDPAPNQYGPDPLGGTGEAAATG